MGNANFADVAATAFATTAVGGDYFYSVPELEAIGVPVPKSATYALMLVGLIGVDVTALRRTAS